MFPKQIFIVLVIVGLIKSSSACGRLVLAGYGVYNYGISIKGFSLSTSALTCDGFGVWSSGVQVYVPENTTYAVSLQVTSGIYMNNNGSGGTLLQSSVVSATFPNVTSAITSYGFTSTPIDYCDPIIKSLPDPFAVSNGSLSFMSFLNATFEVTDMRQNGSSAPNITKQSIHGDGSYSWMVYKNILLVNSTATLVPRYIGRQPYRFNISGFVNTARAKLDISVGGFFNSYNASFGTTIYLSTTPCDEDTTTTLQLAPSLILQNTTLTVEVDTTDSWLYLIFVSPDSSPRNDAISVRIEVSNETPSPVVPPTTPVHSPIYKKWWLWVSIFGGLAIVASVGVVIVRRRKVTKGYQPLL